MEFKMKNLVKGQRYKEAANLKKKINKLLEESNEEYMRKINFQYRILQENFMKKINNDKLVLEQRLKSEREDLLTRREEDMEMLLQKFKIYREKQEQQHKQELIQKSKELKNFNPCSNYDYF